MDSSHQIHPPQVLGGHPSFFYYSPDFNADHRQHRHFSPHPTAVQDDVQFQQQGYQQDVIQGQTQRMYPRRMSSGSPIYLQSKPPHAIQPNFITMASPRPMHQRPSFLGHEEGQHLSVDTECGTPDVYVYPSTPPLSVSGSSISSPPSTCSVLPTPVSGQLFTLENIEGVKEGCEGDVKSEILAGGDWTRSCSPPLTPGKFSSHCGKRGVAVRMALRTSREKFKFFQWQKYQNPKIQPSSVSNFSLLQYLSTRDPLRLAYPPTSFRLIPAHLSPLHLHQSHDPPSQKLITTFATHAIYSLVRPVRVSAALPSTFRRCLPCAQGTTRNTNFCWEANPS